MGIVWRAYDQVLHRQVAVKEVMVPAAMGEDESAAYQRTLREAQTVARLNHPNIVTVYDVAEENGRLWIVMELIPSGSLEERIGRPRSADRTPGGQNRPAVAQRARLGACRRGAAPGREAEQRPASTRVVLATARQIGWC